MIALTAFARVALAGVRFDFETSVTGSRPYSYSGRISVDTEDSRMDISSGTHPLFNPNFSVITRRDGSQLLIIDHAHKQYFLRNTEQMRGHLSTAGGIGKTTASEPVIRVAHEPGGSIDGTETEKHVLHAEYQLTMLVEGESLKAAVIMDVASWVTGRAPRHALPWGLHFAAKTGFPAVDRQIARNLSMGTPLKEIVTVSRRIEGGPSITETITTTISHLSETGISPRIFDIPAGYILREPTFEFEDVTGGNPRQ